MAVFYDPTSRTLDYKGFDTIYSQESLFQVWLDVEKALVKAQVEYGVIPHDIGKLIVEKCHVQFLNIENIERDFAKTGHGLIPLLNELSRVVGDVSAKYVHYGITTQNVQQTSEIIIAKKFVQEFQEIVQLLFNDLDVLNKKHGHIVMAGRTHSKHALPIRVSYKLSVWRCLLYTSDAADD